MMAQEFMIQFEQVSKRYATRTRSLRERLSGILRRRQESPSDPGHLWALQDVSFAVERGETLGIVGENGAGKSTILKLIAGITAPTTGQVRVTGRVASLIELGAGFNLDLTGRENIYLNGAVLGLSRREIEERYERIAQFSGLDRFLEVPVKYYSSGMYARLGFSIAVHVSSDVMLTDEILSVGDAVFQRQCLKRIQELQRTSTVVFVSHDLATVKHLCSRVLWIKEGRLQMSGPPAKVVDAYLESLQFEREVELRAGIPAGQTAGATRWGSGQIEIEAVTTRDALGQDRSVFRTGEDMIVRLQYRVTGPFKDPGFGVQIYSDADVCLHGTNTFVKAVTVTPGQGTGFVEVRYPKLPLLAGTYWLTAGATSGNDWSAPYDVRMKAHRFEVMTSHPDGGIVSLEHRWSPDVQA
jgi:ABC-type polysaccharide/polyol phosphate transport system ATPase subunit